MYNDHYVEESSVGEFGADPVSFMGWICFDSTNFNFNTELVMKYSNDVKIVVFVPIDDADSFRAAVHEAGAGKIGDYSHCSWSTRGIGRFKPEKGADPTIGQVGKLELVEEERIEFICPKELLSKVITTIKKVHPYEEVAYDVFERLDV